MKYHPPNTLAYFNGAPQTHRHDLSALPTSVFAAATKQYRVACGTAKPQDEAVTFYVLNHCASLVRTLFTPHEPLPEWARTILHTYTDVCMTQGERLLHYLLCISTRETRHLHAGTATFWHKVQQEFGDASVDVLKHLSSHGNEMEAVKKYQDTPPSMSVGQYTKTLAYGFHHGSYSGGYGGTPWGLTTDALVAMLHGTTSLELLVDTGYTLAHNGGPIFDKGMMYEHYDASLLTVLDVQRAGQMLDLMFATETLGIKRTPEALEAATVIREHLPQAFKGSVDWVAVEAQRPAKSKNDHPHKYDKVIGKAPKAAKAPKVAPVVVPPALTHVQGKPVTVTGTWKVSSNPPQSVTVYKRTETE